MKTRFGKIHLYDISKKELGIYVRLEKRFQSRFFSEWNTKIPISKLAKKIDVDKRRVYQWKIENVAFPLHYGRLIARKHSRRYSCREFHESIREIKLGQRSKPLCIKKHTFPIKKDPYYWNLLFSLFCDGSSDMWSSQSGRAVVRPSYTSYSKEIMDNFISLAQHKFGNWDFKVSSGTVRVPPAIDIIFKQTHEINSFNTKSERIEKFRLDKKFESEIRNLCTKNKTAILIRFLLDEGNKSERSLNQRHPDISITLTSEDLLNILRIVLNDLKIDYHYFARKKNSPRRKRAYTLQIKRGENRENYGKLRKCAESLKDYPLCKLSDIQANQLALSVNYDYRKPRPELTHSKIPQFIIVNHIITKERTTIMDIMSVLKENGFDLNPNSVFSLLKRMPIARNKRAILSTRELEDYVPYSKRQIDDAERYKQALKIFSSGKTIAETSRLVNKPWSTVRDWVYNVTRPSPLHGPWKAAIESD